jgi:hypothetical protein
VLYLPLWELDEDVELDAWVAYRNIAASAPDRGFGAYWGELTYDQQLMLHQRVGNLLLAGLER